MKKSNEGTVDLLYLNKNKPKNRKKSAKKNKKTTKSVESNNTKINLDNEIIIGLTPKKIDQKQVNSKNRSKANKQVKKKISTSNKKINKNQTKKDAKKRKVKLAIIKWTCLVILLMTAIILFLLSDVFNIKQIVVTNNSKISSEEIINLSTLKTNTNMFKTTNKTIREGIKSNPYIEDVKIKRNLNGVVTLEVTERVATYMLNFANGYVYINNQGYMLEISEEAIKVPIITGFQTPTDAIQAGNRLVEEDLKKLGDVIKIMESAKSNSMSELITQIDITDSENYQLILDSESKTVQFGTATDINIKLLRVKALIEEEKGKEGEIYFQDANKTVFREEV